MLAAAMPNWSSHAFFHCFCFTLHCACRKRAGLVGILRTADYLKFEVAAMASRKIRSQCVPTSGRSGLILFLLLICGSVRAADYGPLLPREGSSQSIYSTPVHTLSQFDLQPDYGLSLPPRARFRSEVIGWQLSDHGTSVASARWWFDYGFVWQNEENQRCC
ncbi:MAG: hypothetical protein R3E84_21805 [Pseudomonadales bacterium]